MESVALFEEKVAIQPSDLSGRDSKGKNTRMTSILNLFFWKNLELAWKVDVLYMDM